MASCESSLSVDHKCTLNKKVNGSRKVTWYELYRQLISVSPSNPLRYRYFRSDVALRREQIRQLKISKVVIHPFSKVRAWYDMFLIYLYVSVLVTKPMDAAFIQKRTCTTNSTYLYYTTLTDFFCLVDVIINFFTGYELKNINVIELRMKSIFKNYVFGYFFLDVLSSLPRCTVYLISRGGDLTLGLQQLLGVVSLLGLLKVARITTFVNCIWRTADYLHISSRGVVSLASILFGAIMIVHWLACMQFSVPRLFRINFHRDMRNASWFLSETVYNGKLYDENSRITRYNHCLFRSSACILGVALDFYELKNTEEIMLAIFTYIVGKILMAFIWIILVGAILNSRLVQIKYAQLINQLQEYMKQKQLPENLRSRIMLHFAYNYQNKYFKEQLITSVLSDTLRREATLFSCKTLMQEVSLFAGLSPLEIGKVVQVLIPEIYLPNDTIIHAGTQGDAMYFLSSGTVAVYTRSGREICHLQDGAYFGEIALVSKHQLRSASIVALETSQVYRLDKKDLQRCLLSNKAVMSKILKNAETRLKRATKLEEEYKEILFEKSLSAKTD